MKVTFLTPVANFQFCGFFPLIGRGRGDCKSGTRDCVLMFVMVLIVSSFISVRENANWAPNWHPRLCENFWK